MPNTDALAPRTSVQVQDAGPVRYIILSRPESRNALDLSLRRELAEEVRKADDAPSCRAVVLLGAGRVFCAGGEITSLGESADISSRDRLELAADVSRAILDADVPVVAGVHGGAWGAGFAIALACDLVVLGRSARLVASFGRFGLVGDTGIFELLRRRVGPARAREILLLNASLSCEEAATMGLVTAVVEDDEVVGRAHELALRLAGAGAGANAWTKRLLRDEQMFEERLEPEIAAQLDLLDGPCFDEGKAAFVEKRQAQWWDDLDVDVPPGLPEIMKGRSR